jgi:hypothetical protein
MLVGVPTVILADKSIEVEAFALIVAVWVAATEGVANWLMYAATSYAVVVGVPALFKAVAYPAMDVALAPIPGEIEVTRVTAEIFVGV